jgi:tripartite-type tricarboxylate transporter receptor subunit TctC
VKRLWIAAVLLSAASAWAQQFPARAVTIIVPYPPSGSNDVFARALGKKLSEAWKQPVIVDNKPGAGGAIGSALVNKAAADGYTLLFLSSSFTTAAAIQPNLPFDAVTGFTPLASVAKGPMVLTVKNDLAARSVAELVALARAQPGKLNYGSSGVGSINHFATELFAQAAGVKLTHVPYKGMGPATTDAIAGHIDVLVASAPSIMQHVRTNKLRGLGITSAGPSPVVPELGPVAPGGAPGYSVELWWGLLAPPSMPAALANQINAEVNRALASADMKETLAREGTEPWPLSAGDFAKVIRDDIDRWKRVAKDANIKPE